MQNSFAYILYNANSFCTIANCKHRKGQTARHKLLDK